MHNEPSWALGFPQLPSYHGSKLASICNSRLFRPSRIPRTQARFLHIDTRQVIMQPYIRHLPNPVNGKDGFLTTRSSDDRWMPRAPKTFLVTIVSTLARVVQFVARLARVRLDPGGSHD